MKTKVFKINDCAADVGDIGLAAKIIEDGGLVAFATETVYGIGCLAKHKVLDKLDKAKGRGTDKRYSLHIAYPDDLHNYVPRINARCEKLIDAFWPGPLTVVFEVGDEDITALKENLGGETIESLYTDNTIGVRCPDNEIAQLLLEKVNGAVVASSANLSGDEPATTAGKVIEDFDGKIEAILDGEPKYGCKYNKSSTVVKVSEGKIDVLRAGAISQNEIEEKSSINIRFVCTGNTCRSPMAEYFCKKYMSEKLNCNIDELGKLGYKVGSAGIMASDGYGASYEVIDICGEKGIDATGHRSRSLSEDDVKESDFIFVMTRGHFDAIVQAWPWAAEKCFMLDSDDVTDPIGAGEQVYRACAEQIEDCVKRVSENLL